MSNPNNFPEFHEIKDIRFLVNLIVKIEIKEILHKKIDSILILKSKYLKIVNILNAPWYSLWCFNICYWSKSFQISNKIKLYVCYHHNFLLVTVYDGTFYVLFVFFVFGMRFKRFDGYNAEGNYKIMREITKVERRLQICVGNYI